MGVVADYMDGNCRIVIHDDFVIRDPGEIKRHLAEIAEIHLQYLRRTALAEAERARASAPPAPERQKQIHTAPDTV